MCRTEIDTSAAAVLTCVTCYFTAARKEDNDTHVIISWLWKHKYYVQYRSAAVSDIPRPHSRWVVACQLELCRRDSSTAVLQSRTAAVHSLVRVDGSQPTLLLCHNRYYVNRKSSCCMESNRNYKRDTEYYLWSTPRIDTDCCCSAVYTEYTAVTRPTEEDTAVQQ